MSNKDYNNETNKINDQQKGGETTTNHNNKLVTEFSLSENTKTLGILRIAREHNTIVVEIKNGESEDGNDPFVIRRAIDFKSWNNFIKEIKTSLFSDLQFEFERKHLNRIIASIETVINRNYEIVKNPVKTSSDFQVHLNQQKNGVGGATNNPSSIGGKTVIEEEDRPIPFLTINNLVKKQTGTFNTKGTIVSITPIMQAISKIKWKCSNDRTDANGSPDCANPYSD